MIIIWLMKYMYLLVKCSSNWMTTIFALATLCFDIFVKTKLGSMRDDKPHQTKSDKVMITLIFIACFVYESCQNYQKLKTD